MEQYPQVLSVTLALFQEFLNVEGKSVWKWGFTVHANKRRSMFKIRSPYLHVWGLLLYFCIRAARLMWLTSNVSLWSPISIVQTTCLIITHSPQACFRHATSAYQTFHLGAHDCSLERPRHRWAIPEAALLLQPRTSNPDIEPSFRSKYDTTSILILY